MFVNDALNLLNLTSPVTQAEIKAAYKKASLKYHPDRNTAGAEMMKVINAAFECLKKLGDTVEAKEGFKEADSAEDYSEILNALHELDGLEIEICGNWIWITGDTRKHKGRLGRKEGGLGCFYSKNKKAWYYRPAEYKSFGRSGASMDEIRAKYGSEKPAKSGRKVLAA